MIGFQPGVEASGLMNETFASFLLRFRMQM